MWYDLYSNVMKLAQYLVETGGLLTPEEVIDYFREPHKWSPEWREMQATTPYPDMIGDVEIEVARCKRCGRNTREHDIDVQSGLCGDCGQDMIDRDSEDRAMAACADTVPGEVQPEVPF